MGTIFGFHFLYVWVPFFGPEDSATLWPEALRARAAGEPLGFLVANSCSVAAAAEALRPSGETLHPYANMTRLGWICLIAYEHTGN